MIYNKIELTNKKALELDGMEIEVLDNSYIIFTSTIEINGHKVVNEMTVDGYRNGEWDDEISDTFYVGDIIDASLYEWAQFI